MVIPKDTTVAELSNKFFDAARVVDASNITMIKDVDPMLDNITVHGRCISLWHSHGMNQAHNPYNLDMVLHDSQNSRIQVYIKKEWMFRFEPLFQEGQCYAISNFAIAENSGKLPLLPHKYKISFYKGTVVTRIDSFDNNVNGFILEPFNRLLDGTRQYHEHEAVVGTPSIHNALFGTKMFINRDLPEILSFRQQLKELPEYDESQFKILCSPLKSRWSLLLNFLMSDPVIHMIYKENGWAYTACKECNKKVNVVESKAMSSAGKSKVTFYCEDHGAVQVASSYGIGLGFSWPTLQTITMFALAAKAAPDYMNGWVERKTQIWRGRGGRPEEGSEMEEEEEMDADEQWDGLKWILPYQGADPLYPPPPASDSDG
ncbi:replication protein A 70 kDa DNA-binding subunit B [Tanacetum coccineum]